MESRGGEVGQGEEIQAEGKLSRTWGDTTNLLSRLS